MKRLVLPLFIFFVVVLTSCSTPAISPQETTISSSTPKMQMQTSKITELPKKNEISRKAGEEVQPNEVGKIMVVMFHNFVESFTPTKSDNGEYTTTFTAFEQRLDELYHKGYRLLNVNDYLKGFINVPAGTIPMIFTFDDGSEGQFHLIRKNGVLTVNPKSAVGILQKFNKKYPDFGMKGTFYINLGLNTFAGEGTIAERLQYLTKLGFEIGNHTYNHMRLDKAQTAEEIQKGMGINQKLIQEFLPGYQFTSLALPYGQASQRLRSFVESGEYQGIKYSHSVVMEVGAGPTVSPIHIGSTLTSMSRVRASGMKPVIQDLEWWLQHISKQDQFISDGNPATFTVPKSMVNKVSKERLQGKSLVLY